MVIDESRMPFYSYACGGQRSGAITITKGDKRVR
jgi:hypothetical protein